MNLLKPKFWGGNNLIVFFLWPLTLITRLIILIKNKKIPYKSNISTICVGNIYLGGTGKTPLVIKINQILKKKNKTFVIKKNYKNQVDEQILLKKRTNLILPKYRIDGLKKVEKSKKNIAIFDDGLQDKSIKYSISIVCFNSIAGIGNGNLLPAGPLREDLSELKNYNAVFINGKKNINLIKEIKKNNKNIKIFSGNYYLKNKLQFNKNLRYLAFCSIGTPESFLNLLQQNNIKVEKKIIFPDHYNYKFSDIIKIMRIADNNHLKIVTTEKDYVKIKRFKKLKTKIADIDLQVDKYSNFKKFLLSNL